MLPFCTIAAGLVAGFILSTCWNDDIAPPFCMTTTRIVGGLFCQRPGMMTWRRNFSRRFLKLWQTLFIVADTVHYRENTVCCRGTCFKVTNICFKVAITCFASHFMVFSLSSTHVTYFQAKERQKQNNIPCLYNIFFYLLNTRFSFSK